MENSRDIPLGLNNRPYISSNLYRYLAIEDIEFANFPGRHRADYP
jgi:hypothetical protein